MSGIPLQETQELISQAGKPTARALTVQGAGAGGGLDPSLSYQAEFLAGMAIQRRLLVLISRQLENLTGERISLDDIEDPLVS